MNYRMTDRKHELSGSEELAVEIAAIQPRLYGFILRRLADREQTLEVLQRTNLVICQKADQATRADSLLAWAIGVARLEVLAHRRSARKEHLLFDSDLVELIAAESPAATEVAQESIAALRFCVEQLPPMQRELVRERYRPDAKVKEMAHRRGKKVESVTKALHRARKVLLSCIERRLRKEFER